MVDKTWYDWQNAHPENFWSFLGGSVGGHSEPGLFTEYPTGGPPFLNVSERLIKAAFTLVLWLIQPRSIVWFMDADGWNPPKHYDLPGHGYQERGILLRL